MTNGNTGQPELFGNSEQLESCKDAVSRKDAIECACGVLIALYAYDNDLKKAIDAIKRQINYLPSAQQKVRTEMSLADCISRQAAIDAAEDWFNGLIVGRFDGLKKRLQALPSVQSERKENKWIPCSEDLPDDLIPVNVTWTNHKPETYYENIKGKRFVDTAVHYQGYWYWWDCRCIDLLKEYGDRAPVDIVDSNVEFIAWKPLPEPWRGEPPEAHYPSWHAEQIMGYPVKTIRLTLKEEDKHD